MLFCTTDIYQFAICSRFKLSLLAMCNFPHVKQISLCMGKIHAYRGYTITYQNKATAT